eukprot:scaffold50070_cov112-Isochrysis_galbana.AAC.1
MPPAPAQPQPRPPDGRDGRMPPRQPTRPWGPSLPRAENTIGGPNAAHRVVLGLLRQPALCATRSVCAALVVLCLGPDELFGEVEGGVDHLARDARPRLRERVRGQRRDALLVRRQPALILLAQVGLALCRAIGHHRDPSQVAVADAATRPARLLLLRPFPLLRLAVVVGEGPMLLLLRPQPRRRAAVQADAVALALVLLKGRLLASARAFRVAA